MTVVSLPPAIAAATVTVGAIRRRDGPPSHLPPVDTLFVWDFDWTIVNCNSDEYIPARFLGDACEQRLRGMIEAHGPEKWHECVASIINSCMEECGECSRQDICDAAANMPYLEDVRGSLEDVADAASGQAIISDGNDVFINEFLKRNEIKHFFTHGVETNFGSFDGDDKFSVVHQSTKYGGHSCKTCPPNLCKSQVLREILSGITDATARPRIVYVGDGSNDACPALNVLKEGDVLLARHGKRIRDPNSRSGPQKDADDSELAEKSFPILSAIKKAKEREGLRLTPKCRVCSWNSGKDLRALVRALLGET